MSLPRVANAKRKASPTAQPSSDLFQLTGEPLTKKNKVLPSPKPSPRKESKFIIVDDDDDDDEDFDEGGTEATESSVSSCASDNVIKSSGESSTVPPTNPDVTNPILIDDDDDDIAQILFFDGAEGCLLETSPAPLKEGEIGEEVGGGEDEEESSKLTSVRETQQKDFQSELSNNKSEFSPTKKLETTPKKSSRHRRPETPQKKSEDKKSERGSSKSKSHKKSKSPAAVTIKIDDDDDDDFEVIDDEDDDDDYNGRPNIMSMFLKAAHSQVSSNHSSSISASVSSSASLASSSFPSSLPSSSSNAKRSHSFSEQKNFSLVSSNSPFQSADPTQRIQRKSSSISLLNRDNDAETKLFIDKYTPETSSELAVSDSAIKAFTEWANTPEFRNSKRILIISGPSGAGKTTMVRVVCKELGFSTIEYSPYGSMARYDAEGNMYSMSAVDDFRSWVMRAAKGPSILSDCPLRFLVLEDFPFINSENSMKFRAVFTDYLRFPKVMPMVIILSDSERYSRHSSSASGSSKNMAYSIVSSFLLSTSEINPWVHSIKVNPVTLKKMRQALTKVSAKYGVKMAMTTVNDIVQECGKDIRSAMNMLQFSQFDFVGKKINCRKDFELSLFHGAGKILHPRFKELSPDISQAQFAVGSGGNSSTNSGSSNGNGNKKTKSYPEHFLLESSGVKPHQIVECAIENMYGFISDIDSLADAFEAISLGDSIGGRRCRAKQVHGNAVKTSEEAQLLVASYGIMNNITTESHKFYGLHASKLRSMEHLVKENSRALSTIFDEFVCDNETRMYPNYQSQMYSSQQQQQVLDEGPPSWILSKCALLTEVIPFSGHLNEGKEYFKIVKELNYDIPDEMISDK